MRLICCLAVTFIVGCVQHSLPSDGQRSASFAALSGIRIEGETLDRFLRQRTAILIAEGRGEKSFMSEAIAVDSRGYFLTAAHSLAGGNVRLIYVDGADVRIVTPRVVAKMTDQDKYDFALIHVERTLPHVFEWSSPQSLTAGQSAAAVGNSSEVPVSAKVSTSTQTCMAGRILSTSPSGDLVVRIFHDLPLRPGDSGGPLATADGKLLGLNTGSQVAWNGQSVSLAIRPNPTWIARQISDDVATAEARKEQNWFHHRTSGEADTPRGASGFPLQSPQLTCLQDTKAPA